jgi:hypothetical protein
MNGLIEFRSDRVSEWVGQFAESASRSAHLARAYLGAVRKLDLRWRKQLTKGAAPRADAAAWAIMDVLPAHPMISAPVAAAATGRAKAAIYQAISQLEDAGVLLPVSRSLRNQIWEVAGLLDLQADFESGRLPIASAELVKAWRKETGTTA